MLTKCVLSVVKFLLLDLPLLFLSIVQVYFENIFHFFIPPPLKSLTKDIILVTGSANGLGREICLALSKSGATLICWDTDKKQNEELVKILQQSGTKAYSYILDISKHENIKTYAEKVQAEVGSVTMIINNAGIFYLKKIQHHSPEEVEKMFKINVLSHFWILEQFLPTMIEKKYGHIVGIATAGVYLSTGQMSCYISTKHAIHGMMESLRDEIARTYPPTKIKLTTVYPHIMDTNLSKNLNFNVRFPIMAIRYNPRHCAKQIVDGIQRNFEYIDVPWLIVFGTKMAYKLLPPKILSKFLDTLGFTEKNVFINEPK